MRISEDEHRKQPWRIHELASDFTVEDVWAYRTPGAREHDFGTMLTAMRTGAAFTKQPALVRFLFALRWRIGAILKWDDASDGVGVRVTGLRERLPPDLRDAPRGFDNPAMPLQPVYELENEAARELANKTVHTVMHLGWVKGSGDDYELHMAVLVKPNGVLGRLYMLAIAPFRYLFVYPAITRQWENAWLARERSS